jgi:DNA-binding NtrC family response regulator
MSEFGRAPHRQPCLFDLVQAYERRLIEEALTDAQGSQRRAAAILGILPTTLHEKMKRHGLLQHLEPFSGDSGLARIA